MQSVVILIGAILAYQFYSILLALDAKLENKFNNLENKFNNLENKFNNLENKFENKFNNLENRLNIIEKRITEPRESSSISISSAGRIRISPASTQGNSFASGSLVRLNDKFYFLTAKHVVKAPKPMSCLRHIVSIELHPNIKLDIGRVFLHPKRDISLIEVLNLGELEARAAVVSPDIVKAHDTILGTSYREYGLVALKCAVVEINSTSVLSDCGRTHGFSGCGYLKDGKLVAVHRGAGDFVHHANLDYGFGADDDSMEDDDSFAKFDYSSSHFFESKLQNSTIWISDWPIFKEWVAIVARNPRTSLVSAHHAYNIPHETPDIRLCSF